MDKPKEPGPYFHVSLTDEKIEDLFQMQLGFYRLPTFAYYGVNFPYGGKRNLDLLCIVKGSGFQVTLPDHILSIIQSTEEVYYTYPPPNKKGNWDAKPIRIPIPCEIDFYFVISDLSDLVFEKGNVVNLVNHAWAITDFHGPRRFKHIPCCIIPISGVRELENNGVKFNELRAEYMSMHFKQGSLCISPNNHKVLINPDFDINKLWTISIHDEQPKAVVSLQWLITKKSVGRHFVNAKSLRELLNTLNDPLLDYIFRNI